MEQCQAQRRDQVETPREVPIHKQQLIKYVIIVRFLFISFTCHAMASSRCLISSPQTRRPRPRRLCLSLVPLRLLAAVYEQQKVLLSDNPTTIQIICKRRFGDPHYSFRKCPVFSLVFPLAFSHVQNSKIIRISLENHKHHEITVTHRDEPGGTLLTFFRPKSSKLTYSARSAALQSLSSPPF